MYSEDFIVTIIEDYTRGKVFSNMIFYDLNLADSTSETILSSLLVFYIELRKLYVSMIHDKIKITNEIILDDLWDAEYIGYDTNDNNGDDLYIRKPVFIVPRKRRYPKGCKVDENKRVKALKFNIILEDNEIFIDSFARKQRYLKSNGLDKSYEIEDLRVGRLQM